MSQKQRYSDEFLNAFVDNQIDADEKSRAYIEIGKDESLNRHVCELRNLHDLVQLAYREPPAPPARPGAGASTRHASLRFGMAATVLLTLGILLGSLIRVPVPATTPQTISAPGHSGQRVVKHASHKANTPAPGNLVATAAPIHTPPAPAGLVPSKVLIHLARDDVAQLDQALDDIEGLLKHYRETHQSARVEVVVNGKGLQLVRVDKSAFAARIQRLQREYENLIFAACQNTIDRLAREQGIHVRLLPGVITIDSGMAEIMRRQNQGWTYLQV